MEHTREYKYVRDNHKIGYFPFIVLLIVEIICLFLNVETKSKTSIMAIVAGSFFFYWLAQHIFSSRRCPVCKEKMCKKPDKNTSEFIHYCEKNKIKINTFIVLGENS